MNVELVPYTEEFLDLSWIWLNDPEIKSLTNTPSFTKEEQISWFNSLPKRKDYKIWGIKLNGTPIGVCGLKNITDIDCEYWGYIGDKKHWGKGIGSKVMELLIEYAKDKNLQSIWLTVLEKNLRAIKLYEKYGFLFETQEKNKLVKMRLAI